MSNSIVPVKQSKQTSLPTKKFIVGSDISAYKDTLIEKYRQNNPGVLQKIQQNPSLSADDLLVAIIIDLLRDSQGMLGNQLLFSEQGNLRDATAITVNRSNLLKAVADITAKRKELNQKAADVDLNSPAFMLFQKMCFEKMVDSLEELKIDQQMIQLVLTHWSKRMQNWGKELKAQLEELAQ